jgi:dTMP kinase
MFVTIEGGEGAGKSTQARALANRLRDAGYTPVLTREPGGTSFGEIARSLVLHHAIAAGGDPFALGEIAELLLFAAARAQHVAELIRPALDRGDVVICDRFTDSTIAYQGYGRGIPLEVIEQTNAIATRGLRPDLTVLLDLPVDVGMARRLGEREADQFEQEALSFHERIRQGFLALVGGDPDRWLVLDATRAPETITEAIWERVSKLLDSRA